MATTATQRAMKLTAVSAMIHDAVAEPCRTVDTDPR
jgi:hypothetical protein